MHKWYDNCRVLSVVARVSLEGQRCFLSHGNSGNGANSRGEMFHNFLLQLRNVWMLSTLPWEEGQTSGCMCGGCEC